MGCHIAHDESSKVAVFYCSTSEWAFGPVFSNTADHYADERAEAFLRWLRETNTWSKYEKEPIQSGRRDPRELTDGGLALAFSTWLAQEAEQWAREDRAIFTEDEPT